MTIADAIAAIRRVKPHQYDDSMLVGWLSDLDGKVWTDLLSRFGEEAPQLPYDPRETAASLLIPFPYENLYVQYLGMMIDYHNAEYEDYNNGMTMFAAQYQGFLDAYNRTHMGKQPIINGVRSDYC